MSGGGEGIDGKRWTDSCGFGVHVVVEGVGQRRVGSGTGGRRDIFVWRFACFYSTEARWWRLSHRAVQ